MGLGFPQKWVESAIPYGQLKKCIKKVTNELQELGLDKDMLAQLASSQKSANDASAAAAAKDIAFHYNLDEDGNNSKHKHLRPRLTVFVHLSDGVAVDASLTPSTRRFLERLAAKSHEARDSSPDSNPTSPRASLISPTSSIFSDPPMSPDRTSFYAEPGSPSIQRVEVPLVFDGEFFNILQTDVSNLDNLQEEEQKKMLREVSELGREIALVTKPSKGRRSRGDLAKWREIFELYLEARVFFSTRESDHGARTSAQALEQLQWFQAQVLQRKIVEGLRLDASRQAYSRFLHMNSLLLQNVKFQEINNIAVTKILKSTSLTLPWPLE